MGSHFLEKMGFISNQISRETLKPGDHIYSWRIYIGDEKVIQFTCGGGLETGTGTFLDKILVSVIPNHKGDNPCPNCGERSIVDGVISSCLDCFLSGGNIYLFEYSVSPAAFIAKPRRGTCTIAPSDPCDEVISRAKYLLFRNGFGDYHALENNCEDFAIYCKTSLLVGKNYVLGRGGQASSVSAAAWLAQLSPFGSKAIQLFADIGVRKDAIKVPVESLVARAYATGTSRNRS